MDEMTRHERILAASHRQRADRLPFFHYWRHSQVGWAERECRNRGMGLGWCRPCAVERLHGVEISEQHLSARAGHGRVRRTYTTPVGSVWVEELSEPGVGRWHPGRSWRDVSPWQTRRLIQGPEDYPVVQYMVEHTEYVADPFPLEQAIDWVGSDGVVLASLPHSPMNTLLIDWIGSEGGRCFYHLADYLDLVEGLYHALCRSREPLVEIAARSPAEVVLCGDNLDGFLVSPPLFRRYFRPVYAQQAAVLHAHDKLMAVHMDGRVASLVGLIGETSIDIVEALHPPPMGDLPLSRALAAWPDKAIWVGFPGSVYLGGPAATRRYTLDLLREMGTGERVVVQASTENLVSNENLVALTSVLEQAELPLRAGRIAEIEQMLGEGPESGS
jgi:hypothetical protein